MATRTPLYSSGFGGGAGVALSSPWVQTYTYYGSVRQDGTGISGQTAQPMGGQPAAYYNGTYSADQYSELKITALAYLDANATIGVIVRSSANQDSGTNNTRDHYGFAATANSNGPYTSTLFKVINGAYTSLYSTTIAWAANDTISLEVEGTTLRACRNGVALGGSWTVTGQSDLATGFPGVIISGDGTNPKGDDWVGGDLGSASSIAPLASRMLRAPGTLITPSGFGRR